ncbi:acylneuraminate cytidylyltransferase [Leptospira fletcheri]|uniref:Acylneuraminate cytidylyltransferase n=1 Tax=Leptospira fletcheri TaxID=2484981 RepID=A0A4R9GDT2_9LEPT|nr:glycosyltransferase family protein [Leptospira fletcheri]TGK09962.1 acylneuraminate cytidylyltransferase [Leptospira fletcheri]
MKTAFIVQARMTSTRLPGKILKKVIDKTLLEYQIERLQRVRLVDGIIIATTTNESDQPVVDLCERMNIPYYRGSESDVLSRYYEAATQFGVENIIRVTSDCPIIDPEILSEIVQSYFMYQKSGVDYVSNTLERSFPRGMDAEIFSYKTLSAAHRAAFDPSDREHVTPYIYKNPSLFSLRSVINSIDESSFRLTVDTQEDYELIKIIIETLYPENPEFGVKQVIEFLNKNPEYIKINEHIAQKKL